GAKSRPRSRPACRIEAGSRQGSGTTVTLDSWEGTLQVSAVDYPTRVGVLGLQGDVREHVRALAELGVAPLEVRTPADLTEVDALVLPGGESTTMSLLLESSGLLGPLQDRLSQGMPAFGTCAGMILLAADVVDGRPDQVR